MNTYETIIGLEVHAELNTDTKIYCSCKNEFGSEVNTNCCPICMGFPGTLPRLNESVVDYCIKMGYATGCTINSVTKMDRKNYFYPDLPKAYQISQYDIPLCESGGVEILLDESGASKTIGITRIHIEEDAGKLIHTEALGDKSLVDLNRCGVPLIEIVSEPDMRSAYEAKCYLETIRGILQYLDISDCKMQEGSIRCDVNVSVRKAGEPMGTRCEMKNVNGFSNVVAAIEYERDRQIALIESGGVVEQQTRRWDAAEKKSVLLRTKEDAEDYRYFPEPDLLTISVPSERLEKLKSEIPELAVARLKRLMSQYSLPYYEAELLVGTPEKADFFEESYALGGISAKGLANWLLGDVSRLLNESLKEISDTPLTPRLLCDLVKLVENGTISTTAAKTVLEDMFVSGTAPEQIVKDKGLAQISDSSALVEVVLKVLSENAKVVEDYKGGKTNALGFLVGQCMKLSKGKGNPAMLNELLLKHIDEA